jgi:hypothetical protein
LEGTTSSHFIGGNLSINRGAILTHVFRTRWSILWCFPCTVVVVSHIRAVGEFRVAGEYSDPG